LIAGADRRDALYFADALNRMRPLTEEEATRVAALAGREPGERVLRRWSRADDRLMTALIGDGFSAPEIASRIGRTPWAVRSRIKQLKRKARAHG
jgi:hypothetical protein